MLPWSSSPSNTQVVPDTYTGGAGFTRFAGELGEGEIGRGDDIFPDEESLPLVLPLRIPLLAWLFEAPLGLGLMYSSASLGLLSISSMATGPSPGSSLLLNSSPDGLVLQLWPTDGICFSS